jgi:hypothetical protein
MILAFDQNVHAVEECFKVALQKLKDDYHHENDLINQNVHFSGVVGFNEYGYKILASIKTVPDPFHAIGRLYNTLVQDEMRKQGIKFPSVDFTAMLVPSKI